jgi:integrase
MTAIVEGGMVPGALDGIRVVDLSWGRAGPLATGQLADHGADVTRVEPPGGDPYRSVVARAVYDRGKRSLVLDLDQPGGRDILDRLLATCRSDRLADIRDRALLLIAFGSGGRRRSEIASLRVAQLSDEAPIPVDPDDPQSPRLPCMAIALGRTKTAAADDDSRVLLVGPPVDALRLWLAYADIAKGPVFRALDRWGAVGARALTPQAVNAIVKRRCVLAGLDPKDYSAHGLRSGYLTEAARSGVPLPEAMQQSQHRSVQQAASYYNDSERRQGKAARLAM